MANVHLLSSDDGPESPRHTNQVTDENYRSAQLDQQFALNDIRGNIMDKMFKDHDDNDVRKYPMRVSKYIQTVYSTEITGQCMMVQLVREDYQSLKQDEGASDEWIHDKNNAGLVAIVEYWKVEEDRKNFKFQKSLRFEKPFIRQIEIDEKISYRCLYKSKDNHIYIMHGNGTLSILGNLKVQDSYDFSDNKLVLHEL